MVSYEEIGITWLFVLLALLEASGAALALSYPDGIKWLVNLAGSGN